MAPGWIDTSSSSGDREEFTVAEMLHTVAILPGIKRDFFGRSPFAAALNLMGLAPPSCYYLFYSSGECCTGARSGFDAGIEGIPRTAMGSQGILLDGARIRVGISVGHSPRRGIASRCRKVRWQSAGGRFRAVEEERPLGVKAMPMLEVDSMGVLR